MLLTVRDHLHSALIYYYVHGNTSVKRRREKEWYYLHLAVCIKLYIVTKDNKYFICLFYWFYFLYINILILLVMHNFIRKCWGLITFLREKMTQMQWRKQIWHFPNKRNYTVTITKRKRGRESYLSPLVGAFNDVYGRLSIIERIQPFILDTLFEIIHIRLTI